MKKNVLIFPCEGNSNELHDALSYCVNIEVFGAASVSRHGRYIYKNYDCSLPYIQDSNFIEEFNDYLERNRIDVIIPQHDTVALFLAENKIKIKAKIVQDDIETNRVCRSKILTHELFSDTGFVLVRYKTKRDVCFPAFAKPDIGEGGHGAFVAKSENDLSRADFESYLITECLPGKEYSVDCFTDRHGHLRYVSPRARSRIMAGISVAGETTDCTEEIKEIAETINSKLHFEGLWYFQLKEDAYGKLKLMEISVRCAGSMCLTRARGINLPLLTVYTALGQDVLVFDNGKNVEMDRALFTRYNLHIDYDDVYIDFDDTITLRGEVNPLAMFFLYQCHNKGKGVHLLTRHINDIYESLKKYAIPELLFEDIIHIKDEKPKSEYIKSRKAIFIDNMFKERLDVSKTCGIPVFDADGFEFLLDWRV